MAEIVKIRHAGFVYNKKHVGVGGPDGKKVTTWHPVMAMRDEEVNVDDMHEADHEKGHEIGAFYDDDVYDPETGVHKAFDIQSGRFVDKQVEFTEDFPDLDNDPQAEIVAWVKRSSVAAVIELAQNDPDRAAILLEAENDASGKDPRVTLVRDLDKIIGT